MLSQHWLLCCEPQQGEFE